LYSHATRRAHPSYGFRACSDDVGRAQAVRVVNEQIFFVPSLKLETQLRTENRYDPTTTEAALAFSCSIAASMDSSSENLNHGRPRSCARFSSARARCSRSDFSTMRTPLAARCCRTWS